MPSAVLNNTWRDNSRATRRSQNEPIKTDFQKVEAIRKSHNCRSKSFLLISAWPKMRRVEEGQNPPLQAFPNSRFQNVYVLREGVLIARTNDLAA
jgi:hypothetical protein